MNRRRWTRRTLLNWLGLVALGVIAFGWAVPILWTIAVSVHPPEEALSAGNAWFGSHLTLENYTAAFNFAPFGIYYLNTIIIAFGILAVQVGTISLAGYAFARYRFFGQDVLFSSSCSSSWSPPAH